MQKHKTPLNKEVLQTRLSYIEDSIRSLERLNCTAEFRATNMIKSC